MEWFQRFFQQKEGSEGSNYKSFFSSKITFPLYPSLPANNMILYFCGTGIRPMILLCFNPKSIKWFMLKLFDFDTILNLCKMKCLSFSSSPHAYRIHLRITPRWKHLTMYILPVTLMAIFVNIPLFVNLLQVRNFPSNSTISERERDSPK